MSSSGFVSSLIAIILASTLAMDAKVQDIDDDDYDDDDDDYYDYDGPLTPSIKSNGNVRRTCGAIGNRPFPLPAGAVESNAVFPASGITIPVNFIILFTKINRQPVGDISDDKINAQMDALNAGFNGTDSCDSGSGVDTNIQFTKGTVRRIRVRRKQFTKCYNKDKRLAKKYVQDPANSVNVISCEPELLGWAVFPCQFTESSRRNVIFINYGSVPGRSLSPYNFGDTLTHEMGHYLGLFHTFQGGCDSPGDSVDDTPYEATSAFGCPAGRDTCSSSGDDPIFNFMDYTDDHCMCKFTTGQVARMNTEIARCRPSLLS